jgi:hypothetical protein
VEVSQEENIKKAPSPAVGQHGVQRLCPRLPTGRVYHILVYPVLEENADQSRYVYYVNYNATKLETQSCSDPQDIRPSPSASHSNMEFELERGVPVVQRCGLGLLRFRLLLGGLCFSSRRCWHPERWHLDALDQEHKREDEIRTVDADQSPPLFLSLRSHPRLEFPLEQLDNDRHHGCANVRSLGGQSRIKCQSFHTHSYTNVSTRTSVSEVGGSCGRCQHVHLPYIIPGALSQVAWV